MICEICGKEMLDNHDSCRNLIKDIICSICKKPIASLRFSCKGLYFCSKECLASRLESVEENWRSQVLAVKNGKNICSVFVKKWLS